MHIIHIPRRFAQDSWGGTERVLHRVASHQQESGHQVSIHTSSLLSHIGEDQIDNLAVYRHRGWYGEWPISQEKRERFDRKGVIFFVLD